MKNLQKKLLLAFEQECQDYLAKIRKSLCKEKSEREINELFRCTHNLKGAARTIPLKPIEILAHKLEDIFSQVRLQQTSLPAHTEIIQITLDAIEDFMGTIYTNKPVSMSSSNIEKIDNFFGINYKELVGESNKVICHKDFSTEKAILQIYQQWQKIPNVLLKELEILPKYRDIAIFIDSLGPQLMHILKNKALILESFHNTVEEMAQQSHRKIDFSILGETNISTSLLYKLKNSISHILCNAVCHGIESIEKRKQLHKKKFGKLTLSFKVNYDKLEISLEDDGCGIDYKTIRKKFQTSHKGELENLIFKEGVSTAQKVSPLSGRGVGLAIVSQEIKELKGTIKLDSKENMGTKITLVVPRENTNGKL